jgi:hypothetical protein
MEQCSEPGCDKPATVRVFVPWDEDRDVCTDHGRTLVQQEGVVAEPKEGVEEEWQ